METILYWGGRPKIMSTARHHLKINNNICFWVAQPFKRKRKRRRRRKGKSVGVMLRKTLSVLSSSVFGPSDGHKQKEPTQGDRLN